MIVKIMMVKNMIMCLQIMTIFKLSGDDIVMLLS